MSELIVVKTVNSVVVTAQPTATVEVVKTVNAISAASPGPQGPAGPQGLPGAAGGSVYEHTQSVASNNWVINHNVGRKVAVILFDDDGTVVQSDIEHGTVNQATVTWSQPTTGSALII